MNRLGSATSPYLLQHAENPVHWWEWGEDAFAEARRRDVPVLISVGYAACHWCHVMAHESFEDEAVAAVVNETVVAIKVDREERPDVDAVYMTATQAMTGQGGWPMTVFATPDGHPFYCGTYYPRAGFVSLVRAIGQAWREQRDEVVAQGAAVVQAVAHSQGRGIDAVPGSITAAALDQAAKGLAADYDPTHGGFGDTLKFPPHLVMLFLLRHYQRTGEATSLEIARHTGEAMARGGLYDQLAGGFARYSVDPTWTVPHFEKMLYDNALLLRVYTELHRLTGDALAARVARDTARFLLSLEQATGGFASSLDADTDGVEGATYAWTPAQLADALGPEDGAWAADLFAVTARGSFEHGTSVLRLARDIDEADEPLRQRWLDVRRRLLAARDRRPQPTRDDKVVSAWNGLAITALAGFVRAAPFAGTPPELAGEARRAALAAARTLRDSHVVDGRLRRASRGGVVGEPVGVLDDYGCVAEAFCAAHQIDPAGGWLEPAGALLETALARFDDGAGGFFDTADDAERLVARPADPTDNATPSGVSALAAALTTYGALVGEPRFRDAALRALETIEPLLAKHPRFAGYACATGEALLSGPFEIALAGGHDHPELVETAWRHAPPGAVLVVGPPDTPGVPLLAGRRLLDGAPTAYVCRGFVCDRPVTSAEELKSRLDRAG